VGNLGSAVGAAVAGTRPLESFEFRPLMMFGAGLLLVAAIGFWKPFIVIWPIGALLVVLGLQMISRGIQARFGFTLRKTKATLAKPADATS
jgi:hypothetical protein